MSPAEHRGTETLIEAATTAWRPRSPSGEIRAHPAWADLDVAGRLAAYEAARRLLAAGGGERSGRALDDGAGGAGAPWGER